MIALPIADWRLAPDCGQLPSVRAAGPTGPGVSSHARKGVEGSWLNAKVPKDRE